MEEGGPLLVIAGAGSGKTRTLTYRVARLIERGIKPERILLATFTNKAARSMLSRVQTLIAESIDRLWGGTFHHIAHRILRHHAHLLGYGNNFSILDGEDAKDLFTTCFNEVHQKAVLRDHFPRPNVLAEILSLAKNKEESLHDIITWRFPYFLRFLEEIETLVDTYEKRKKTINVMDFDDLLSNLKRLFTDFPEVLEFYRDRFLHVLVDEYQDTNRIQAEIVDMLASRHRNLMVVGDDSQSIYSFRGANFANIIDFPKRYPDCRIFKLETNYRSTPEILRFANLTLLGGESPFCKTLKAVRSCGVKPAVIPLKTVFQQAAFVVQRIIELKYEGVSLDEIAVLYRAHYHSMELQMELTRFGVPFRVRSGMRFFEQAHIKDVTAYLRILANPHDELAWRRVLSLYSRIGKATTAKIWGLIAGRRGPLTEILNEEFIRLAPKSAQGSLQNLCETLKILSAARQEIGNLIHLVLASGYRDYLAAKYIDQAGREDDLIQLADYAAKFPSLEEFLSELSLLTNMDEETEEEEKQDTVILSSIHQAKGLEWKVVFIIWCTEGRLPLARALDEPGGEEEERRLFYVAVTRAKDQLYLCYPLYDYNRGLGNMILSPSRFIREVMEQGSRENERPYEHWLVEDEP